MGTPVKVWVTATDNVGVTARTITVDGAPIQVVDAQGLPNRRYLWVPSLGAVLGGVLVFSGVA